MSKFVCALHQVRSCFPQGITSAHPATQKENKGNETFKFHESLEVSMIWCNNLIFSFLKMTETKRFWIESNENFNCDVNFTITNGVTVEYESDNTLKIGTLLL